MSELILGIEAIVLMRMIVVTEVNVVVLVVYDNVTLVIEKPNGRSTRSVASEVLGVGSVAIYRSRPNKMNDKSLSCCSASPAGEAASVAHVVGMVNVVVIGAVNVEILVDAASPRSHLLISKMIAVFSGYEKSKIEISDLSARSVF